LPPALFGFPLSALRPTWASRSIRRVILLWGTRKRIVTGADLLGRLLRGIAKRP